MRGPSTVTSGGRMAVGAVMRRRLHVEIVGTTVGEIVSVTIALTVAQTIASCKRHVRHPLVVVTQAVVKNKACVQHMHYAIPRRRTARDAALMTTHRRPPPLRNLCGPYWHTTSPLGPPTRSSQEGGGSGSPSDVPSRLDC